MSKTKGRRPKSGKGRRRHAAGTEPAASPSGTAPPASPPASPSAPTPASPSAPTTAPTAAAAAPTRTAAPAATRPPGQRLFDMPYSSQVPSPVRPDLGLASLVARAGHNAGYAIDLTLLDAADHRLIRTGVLLAHRVLDGRGEWYLGAPDWVPLLPKELILSMGQAELPDDLAELVRPFRRGAPLSPVAALRCERREFALRDADGRTVALLRDDKVTVRRNGLTTARYREVMLTPIGPGLDAAQTEWLAQCLDSAGGTEVDRFPRLVRRLGAPATGPSDLPAPANLSAGTFGQFLTQLLGAGARDLIGADLALTRDDRRAEERLIAAVQILRRRLEGLRDVLGRDWVGDVVDDLDWLAAPPEPPTPTPVGPSWPGGTSRSDDLAALGGPSTVVESEPSDRPSPVGCRARLQSHRYLSLLERLVAAARAPKTGVDATQPASTAVAALYDNAVARLVRAADRLAVEGTAQTWEGAWTAAQDVTRVAAIRALLAPAETAKDRERMASSLDLLERAILADRGAADVLDRVEGLTSGEAFEAGRRFERDRETARTVRSEFLARWSKTRRKLG